MQTQLDPMPGDAPATQPMSNAQARRLAMDLFNKRLNFSVAFDTGHAVVSYSGKDVWGGSVLTGQMTSDGEGQTYTG